MKMGSGERTTSLQNVLSVQNVLSALERVADLDIADRLSPKGSEAEEAALREDMDTAAEVLGRAIEAYCRRKTCAAVREARAMRKAINEKAGINLKSA